MGGLSYSLTLHAFDEEEGSHATIRAIVNPAVPWVWIGGMIMALGAMLAVAPQRRGRPPGVILESRPAEAGEAAQPEEEPIPV
jgi:cytochrome c biogenesis factor